MSRNIKVALASTNPICSPPSRIHPNDTSISDAGASGMYITTDSPCGERNNNPPPPCRSGHNNRTPTQVSVFLHHPAHTTTLSSGTHHANLLPQYNGHRAPLQKWLLCNLRKCCSNCPRSYQRGAPLRLARNNRRQAVAILPLTKQPATTISANTTRPPIQKRSRHPKRSSAHKILLRRSRFPSQIYMASGNKSGQFRVMDRPNTHTRQQIFS